MARQKVVIIGAGFAGLHAVAALKKADVDITLIDRHNYHLFQPLLYQVATAALSPAEIAYPIRHIVHKQKNVTKVLLDKVVAVDKHEKAVLTADGHREEYDYLVVATGARHSYFGNDQWADHALGIKNVDDATALRRKILMAFEKAETETDEQKRQAYLTFVVVGGGPTGVEMAGAIAELARHSIASDFDHIDPESARIILVEGTPRVLGTFPTHLSEYAKKALEKLGVEVMTDSFVEDIQENYVVVGGAKIRTHCVTWAAGVKASKAGEWLEAECDRLGRVIVDEKMNPEGMDDIFVLGDTAAYTYKGDQLPGVAPVAKQQGRFIGEYIKAKVEGKELPTFKYFNWGNLATVGRKFAVMDLGWMRLKGFFAWLMWGVIHIYFLIGMENRFVVAFNWLWNYLTFKRGARLITGDKSE